MIKNRLILGGVFTLALALPATATTIVYSETFSNGTALTSDPLVNSAALSTYWTSNADANGYITQTTNNVLSTIFNGYITAPPAGSNYFLFDGTYNTTIPSTEFFASSNFAVAANTNYTISFQLTNGGPASAPGVVPANITLEVNGVSLVSGITALGYYGDGNSADQWQTFTATWNSGSLTSASIQLLDTTNTGNGNDFGIANIQASSVSNSTNTATPEPSTLALFAAAALFAAGLIRRKRLNQ